MSIDQKKSGFTMVKNGLWESKHRKTLGEVIFLFGIYLSFMHAPKSKPDYDRHEVCVFIYPKSIQKILDIDKETWLSWHQLLEKTGYISSHFVEGNEKIVVCIKKALL